MFTRNVSRLLEYAESLGYECAIAYVKRCQSCKVGKKHSKHKDCLAVDIDLYIDGVWLDKTEHHAELGEYWERIGGAWGGRFMDGNHYEYGDGLR